MIVRKKGKDKGKNCNQNWANIKDREENLGALRIRRKALQIDHAHCNLHIIAPFLCLRPVQNSIQ